MPLRFQALRRAVQQNRDLARISRYAAHTDLESARISSKKRGRIVVLGDSHVFLFSGLPGFMPLSLGPVTLHRLGRPQELLHQVRALRRPILLLPGFRIGHRDTLLISAGEIDIRRHVNVQVTEHARGEQQVVGDLADRIVARLSELRSRVGCQAGVVAVLPPVRELKDFPPPSPLSIRGALDDRVRWTNMLNERLENQLQREGHVFLPMPKGLTDPDGSLREDCRDDTVHLERSLAMSVATGARDLAELAD